MSALIFEWNTRQGWNWRLAVLLFLSVFAHLFAFYVFHISYPPATNLPPPTARVEILNPNRPDHALLLERLQAEDPSLLTRIPEVTLEDLPLTLEVPTLLDEVGSARPTLPAQRADEVQIPQIPIEFVWQRLASALRTPAPAPGAEVPVLQGVRLQVEGELAARLRETTLSMEGEVDASQVSRPAEFLIGVDTDGRVRHLFLVSGSGDRAWDSAAKRALGSVEFLPGEATQGILWNNLLLQPFQKQTLEPGDDL